MNMHLPPQDPAHHRPLAAGDAALPRRRWKPWLIALAVIVALLLFVWFLIARATAPGIIAPPSPPPAISVMVPGTSPITSQVVAIGTIEARRDMPVGVVGEGGMISAIGAEAGQRVKQGQVLAEIDSAVQRAQLAQLQAAVVQADADARLAQSELDRASALVERGFISRADIDRRTATRDSARARVAVAQAQVREMQERIARLAIRAPEAGVVLQRMVEPGQVVSPGSGALFRVAAGAEMELRAKVPEQDMPQLAVNQIATVTPVGSSNAYAGRVWLLEPVIDPQTRQGTARIALPYADELRVGGFANVRINGAQADRPMVPQSAIQTDQDGSFVYVVDGDGMVKRQPVRVGGVFGSGVAVAEGLTGAEQVVVSAGAFLQPGEKVKPVLLKAN